MWDLHTPRYAPTDTCKVVTYTRKSIASVIRNITLHPMASLNTLILDVLDNTSITLCLVNVYHAHPTTGHDLHHILRQEPDDTVPTALVGDFNTHSPVWSLPGCTPSSWGTTLTDWMGAWGFQCLNPIGVPTWVGSREGDQPSVLDLVLANDIARYSAQLGDVTVSLPDSLGSDHAALIFEIYPLDSIAIIPPLAPSGFKVDDELKDLWVKEFVMLLPPCLPYAPEHSTVPSDLSVIRRGVTAHESIDESLNLFNWAINEASRRTLKPNRVPDPRGVRWWNDACSMAHTLAQTAPAGRQRHLAARNLRNTVAEAKRAWAHEQLNEAVDAQNIWRLAKARKGRRTNLFPPLRNADNVLVDNPEQKADIFRAKFFPGEPRQVPTHHSTNHPPIQPWEWAPITTEDVWAALRTTTN